MITNQKSDAGFTLLEVLVALVISAVVALGLAHSFATHLRFNTLSDVRTGAMQAASAVLDELRVKDPASLPAAGTDAMREVHVGSRTYQVGVSYCASGGYCTSNNIRSLHVQVRFRDTLYYEVDTVFSQLR